MSDKNLALFYRQLATMLDAGLPVSRALDVLVEQMKGRSGQLAGRLNAAIKGGATLADGMAAEPKLIPPLHLGLIRAGEMSGRLDDVLVRLAVSLENGAKLRGQLLTRMIYPLIVVHVAVLVKAVVAFFLQGVMEALMSLVFGFAVLYGVMIGGWLLFKLARAVPPTQYMMDVLAWHLPIVSGIVRNIGTARFARTCEALYSSGHNISHTLAAAASATGNAVMIGRLQRAVISSRDGEPLGPSLANTNAFNPMVNSMLQTGAESGRLEQMLRKVAENAEHDAQVAIERLGAIIPVLLYIGIMIWVGYLIISMLVGNYLNMINELLDA